MAGTTFAQSSILKRDPHTFKGHSDPHSKAHDSWACRQPDGQHSHGR